MAWLPVTVTTEPASEPLTVAEAKAQARITSAAEDTLISSYITAARQLVEQYTGTRLVSQTVQLRGSSFWDLHDLPVAPVISVTSVAYLDADGVEQTLPTTVYEPVLVGLEPTIRRKINQVWPPIRPVNDAVRVVAQVGYATVPQPVKHAILLQVATWCDDREVGELSTGAMALLENYRRVM